MLDYLGIGPLVNTPHQRGAHYRQRTADSFNGMAASWDTVEAVACPPGSVATPPKQGVNKKVGKPNSAGPV